MTAKRDKKETYMTEKIELKDYTGHIANMLPRGILLNTKTDKFNSMVIGWGNIGTTWNMSTFVAYVRENRYTKGCIDKTGEFSVSIPLDAPDTDINKICGWKSGRDIDKVNEAGLTVCEPVALNTPGIKEYPLTLECRVLHKCEIDLSQLPAEIREKMYPQDVEGTYPMANRDTHTVYTAQIVEAYIIR